LAKWLHNELEGTNSLGTSVGAQASAQLRFKHCEHTAERTSPLAGLSGLTNWSVTEWMQSRDRVGPTGQVSLVGIEGRTEIVAGVAGCLKRLVRQLLRHAWLLGGQVRQLLNRRDARLYRHRHHAETIRLGYQPIVDEEARVPAIKSASLKANALR